MLAVTFTNKAAREMKERVAHLAGPVAEGMPWLGTFHAISTKILRRHAELVGLKSGFTILDTDDQIRLLKQVIQAENIDDKRWPARALAHQIDAWKNRGLAPKDVPAADAMAFANGKGRECYAHYQERLKILNATDFGDLLLECVRLFRENPDILAEYQRRFRFLLVDEYQDTNTIQYLWLRLLAQGREAGRQNLCCVGDDDQSIYGWRGAEVDNILRFEQDFPGAKVIRLERNYRSTGHILATAAHLIAKNEGRLGKTLFTDGEDGEKATVTGVWDSEEEARTIGETIEQLQHKQPFAGGDRHPLPRLVPDARVRGALHYARAALSRDRRPALLRARRDPRRVGLSALRGAAGRTTSPSSASSTQPKRGLGDATLQLLHDHARRERIPLMASARLMVETEELKPKQRQTLRLLLDDFARWAALIDQKPQGQLAELILEESGYTEMWQKDRTAEAAGRLENLKELVRAMEEFPDLAAFLEHISLVMEASDAGGGEKVSVMTLHAAKGLEFETVFLPGWEEGLFPHQRSLDESGRAGLEEERRLAYVGITRAKRRAKIFFATNRRIHGLWQTTIPSRFLDELPERHVEVVEAASSNAYGGYAQSRFANMDQFVSPYATPGWQRAQQRGAGTSAQGKGYKAEKARRGPLQIEGELVAKSTVASGFAKGARVFHQKFGNGTVAAVDGNKLTVDFDKAGRKMVLESFIQAA